MVDPTAQRLWDSIEWGGGLVALDDAPFHDIECGIIKGWLDPVGIGRFEATEELRRVLGS